MDGARFASLPVEVVEQLGLATDATITEATYERLSYAADVEAARRVAMRLLAARPRAVNEMLRRLRQRGLNPSAVAEAVGRLETAGLLDDREFARHFVRVRAARGHGRSRLLHDLLAKGVDRLVAERAIDRTLDEEAVDESAQVRALVEKRFSQLRDLPAPKAERRILGYLARRGYRGAGVTDVVREVVRGV